MTPTMLTIMHPDGRIYETAHKLEAEPTLTALRTAMFGIIRNPERVSVLEAGERRDMFVEENGHAEGLERNEAATRIYRANAMASGQYPDPEALPCVVGPAVLFARRVWF